MTKKLSITPKKSLGQHFLVNPRILDKIVRAAEISKDDTVLEVGPGTGNLTEKLAEKAKKIIAIEKDRRLIEPLREKFKNTNIEIAEGDVLKFDPNQYSLIANEYKVVANIPYYITSNFIRTVFEKWPKPKIIVLTIQKEVAQRIMVKPPKMNLLALSVQFFAEPKIIGYISKENFRPRPKIDSAIIKLMPRERPLIDNSEDFFKLIKAGFSGKRKQLINNLSKRFGIIKQRIMEPFEKTGINPNSRAENLSLNQWIELRRHIKN